MLTLHALIPHDIQYRASDSILNTEDEASCSDSAVLLAMLLGLARSCPQTQAGVFVTTIYPLPLYLSLLATCAPGFHQLPPNLQLF